VYSYDGYSQGGEKVARIKCFDVSAPAGSAPAITQRSLPNTGLNNWYHERLWVSGGNGLRTWSVLSGELPAGLTLDGSSHMLTGRATQKGSYTFALKVVDADGDSDTKEFTVLVGDQDGAVVGVTVPRGRFNRPGVATAALYGLNGRRVGAASGVTTRGVYLTRSTNGAMVARLIAR
jgi:hypothetical protein